MPPTRIAHEPRMPRRRYSRSARTPVRIAHDPRIEAGSDDETRRLEQAAEVIAEKAREISGRFSKRIPASVKFLTYKGGKVVVRAGGPTAPQAHSFDPPNNPPVRHPLFGNRKHWYPQPYRPFLEEAAEAGIDHAAEVFSRVIDDWAKQIPSNNP
jgi:hypothetical protein